MSALLGLLIFTGHIRGIVILFGGHKKAPQWLKACIAVAQLLLLLAAIGLAME